MPVDFSWCLLLYWRVRTAGLSDRLKSGEDWAVSFSLTNGTIHGITKVITERASFNLLFYLFLLVFFSVMQPSGSHEFAFLLF